MNVRNVDDLDLSYQTYYLLAEGPGVTRIKKNFEKKMLKKIIQFF